MSKIWYWRAIIIEKNPMSWSLLFVAKHVWRGNLFVVSQFVTTSFFSLMKFLDEKLVSFSWERHVLYLWHDRNIASVCRTWFSVFSFQCVSLLLPLFHQSKHKKSVHIYILSFSIFEKEMGTQVLAPEYLSIWRIWRDWLGWEPWSKLYWGY